MVNAFNHGITLVTSVVKESGFKESGLKEENSKQNVFR